ncbi:MAG: alanine--tRNA ligase, partial [Betaproteobacteria bacterium AqS2]|nr:alanine--tRNA ligase [Betaproteobacteria bacterium AqS2]
MDSNEIRERFLAFFARHGHERVASSPLVPGDDPTLTFTNAGMVQFKDVFLGFDKRPYTTAATSQRCLRAGGKHNDLENVGYTSRHHTFFEMLGNFSFGDYFKERAIPLAWELLTADPADGGYGLAPEQLWVTVFGGGKLFGPDSPAVPADEDAAALWRETLMKAGFSAAEAERRITRIPTTDNFWMMGETGPCGPCSEIFYNRDPKATRFEGEDEAKADDCVEIWNLVFMQFNRDGEGVLHDLPAPCVDTGMGLERLCAVLQAKPSNYDTDLFTPLLAAAKKAVEDAGGEAPADSASLRVLADHIRAAAFLVADRVLPSNEGRGYVLRRIIRRALRHGHQLGATKPFFASLAAPLAELMAAAHPEIAQRLEQVTAALAREEERFAKTLHDGMRLLQKRTGDGGGIDGATAFMLYDTYGFPADLTASYARDHGLSVDMEGFEKELAKQQARSRAASGFKVDLQAVGYDGPATVFERDPAKEASGEVLALYDEAGAPVEVLAEGDAGLAVLSATGFYAEAGGQVGDRGVLRGAGGEQAEVITTVKVRGDVHGHQVRVVAGELRRKAELAGQIDRERRTAVCRAHSATHLLHEALRRVLGDHVEQRGSLVEGDRLRFDFVQEQALSDEQLADVEALVCRQALANAPVVIEELPYPEAIDRGAKALFGEKYGSVVRMVQIDPDFSIELCGGTHVGSASEIGQLFIRADEAVAAGIRRIEAHAGFATQRELRERAALVQGLERLLKKPGPALLEEVAALRGQVQELQKAGAKAEQAALQEKLAQLHRERGGAKRFVA